MPNFNLNTAGPQRRERVDTGALEAWLRDYASVWIPREFPKGYRDGDEWVGDPCSLKLSPCARFSGQ